MYLHIGKDTLIDTNGIIAILNIETLEKKENLENVCKNNGAESAPAAVNRLRQRGRHNGKAERRSRVLPGGASARGFDIDAAVPGGSGGRFLWPKRLGLRRHVVGPSSPTVVAWVCPHYPPPVLSARR